MRMHHKFEEKVLNLAKRELDESAPISFTYERETIPWRGRTGEKIIGYTFYPVELPKNRDQNLEQSRLAAKVGNIDSRYGMLEFEVSNLLHHLGFTKEEINALENKKLFVKAQKELTADGVIDGLERIRQSALRNKKVTNLKGYIINGLKTMLNEKTNPEESNIPKHTTKPQEQSDLNNLIGNLADKFKF